MTDDINREILWLLTRNGKLSSTEVYRKLRDKGIKISDRGVRKRIARMEEDRIIKGYSATVDSRELGFQVRKILLLRLKSSEKFEVRVADLRNYLLQSNSCIYSARMSGDIDWISCMVFRDNPEAQKTCDFLRREFHDLVEQLNSYDVEVIKASSFHT